MALRDNDTKPIKEILASMTFKEKVSYLWEYYKWIPIVTVLVIGSLISMIPGFIENSKEVLIGGMTINVILDEKTEQVLTDELFAFIGGTDPSRQKVTLGSSILLETDESGDASSAYAVAMQLAAEVSVSELDYILTDPVGKALLENQGLVTTLDAVFSAEYLETIQERIVYIKNYEGAEVPFAIDLTDTAFAKACHLEKFGLYIAFPGNTGRNDQLDEFVDYLLNWK